MAHQTLLTEAERLRREGRKEGRQKGRREGRRDGHKEGRKEGIQQGFQTMLRNLLEQRFGPLPTAVQDQIAAADSDLIERWGRRVLSARSLDEVFA